MTGARPMPAAGASSAEAGGRRHTLAAHALLLIGVLIATLVGYNDPNPLDMRVDVRAPGLHRQLYDLERYGDYFYRWTDGYAQICLEQAGSLPAATIRLSVVGELAVPLGNDQIYLGVNGRPVARLPLTAETRRYDLLVGAALLRSPDLCLQISSDTAVVPPDPRQLGVPLHALKVRPLVSQGLVLPGLLQTGLNLLLALLLLRLLRWVGLGWWPATVLLLLAAAAVAGAVYSWALPVGLGLLRKQAAVVGLLAMLMAGVKGLQLIDGRRWPGGGAPRYRITADMSMTLLASIGLVGGVWLIQQIWGYGSVWPLKAGWFPALTPWALLPVALFAGWLALVLAALARPDEVPAPLALSLVLAGALGLPPALKWAVRGLDSLFVTFRDSPYEYIRDVPLVTSPAEFLSRYIELAPSLALHSSTHPPGSILLLWAVERFIGPGAVVASLVAIGLSALSAVVAYWLGLRLGGPRIGLLAGATLSVMPGHQIYSVTSMDSVFNAILAGGAALFFCALLPGARRRTAALAGATIALGLFFTYAATQLFFFGAALVVLVWLRQGRLREALVQSSIAAGVIIVAYGLLYLATGYNVVAGSATATAINAQAMDRLYPHRLDHMPFLPPTIGYYLRQLAANTLAFAWYLAPWGLAVLGVTLIEAKADGEGEPFALLALALAWLVAGMLLGGLFNREVERIWAFVYPLAAVLIARYVWRGATAYERLWRAGCFLALFFAQSLAFRLLLNTFW